MVTIDKNIPFPKPPKTGRGAKSEFRIALEKMEVGDSFAIPAEREAYIRVTCVKVAKELKRSFMVCKYESDLRVWRSE